MFHIGRYRHYDVVFMLSFYQKQILTPVAEWMYPQEAVPEMVRMIELGMLKIGPDAGIEASKYHLEDWEAAFSAAEASTFGKYVVFEP